MVPPGTTQDFFLNVGDRVFFTDNSDELSSTATATLNKQIAWLSKYPRYRITIEGHADEKGSKRKNMKLSEQRAQAVRAYLEQHGVEPRRIRTVAYGREKRIAICNDISCWSQNRRVVTVLDTTGVPPVAVRPPPGPGNAGTAPRGAPRGAPGVASGAAPVAPPPRMPAYTPRN
jgi:peptidoglycan-associated lipoprotein